MDDDKGKSRPIESDAQEDSEKIMPNRTVEWEDVSKENWVSYIERATHEAERVSDAAGLADWVIEQRRRRWRWTRMRDWRWTKLLLDWIPIGARRVGRPTMRWEDSLEEFAEQRLGGQRWTEAAKDQAMWK